MTDLKRTVLMTERIGDWKALPQRNRSPLFLSGSRVSTDLWNATAISPLKLFKKKTKTRGLNELTVLTSRLSCFEVSTLAPDACGWPRYLPPIELLTINLKHVVGIGLKLTATCCQTRPDHDCVFLLLVELFNPCVHLCVMLLQHPLHVKRELKMK